MNKKGKIALIASILIALAVLTTFAMAANRGKKACNDGIDNDGDGLTDYSNDPGCSSAQDTTETSPSLVCDDGADAANDRDTLADYRLSDGDPGCSSATDSSEIDGMCDDSLDDASDADSLADGSDPGCTSYSDTSEIDGQCDDKVDNNDRDTLIDYPNDAGCTSYSDDNEINGMCDDSLDDASDADSLADGLDPGCTSYSDNSEISGQCDDLLDNDEDTYIDYPNDLGCNNYQDDSELDDSCSDTDGGIVIDIQGTVSGYSSGYPYSYTDYCINAQLLNEYYCNGVYRTQMNTTCSGNYTSCSNGACV